MTPFDPATCAWCPRLCRHVCPVAVATGRETPLPSAMFTAVVVHGQGGLPDKELGESLAECLSCGACEAHCKHHVPVPVRVAALRAKLGMQAIAEPLERVSGEAQHVCILTGEEDWAPAWSRRSGAAAATLGTHDELGFAAWKAGAEGVIERVAAHLAGRTVVTGSGFVEAVAHAAGLVVERLEPAASDLTFRTCVSTAAPSLSQLACCGRRGGFHQDQPDLAAEVARANVSRLAGRIAGCDDEGCTRWLREHGARVSGPLDALLED